MNNLKISTRLMILGGFMSALAIVLAVLGLYGISKSNSALQAVYENRTVPTGQLGRIVAMMLSNRLAIALALATPSPEVIALSVTTVDANVAEITKIWDTYSASKLTGEEEKLALTVATERKKFVQQGLMPAVLALRGNDLPLAQRLMVETIDPLYIPLKKATDALLQVQVDEASKEFTQATQRYATIRMISIAVFVGGMLLSGVFNLILSRSIVGQLGSEPGEAMRVAQAVGASDLSQTITVAAGDTNSLMASLKSMQNGLIQMVIHVRQDSERLAAASAEIAHGNHNLSARTESQASALEQTAAAMEQLGVTVRQNADNAVQANKLALQASTVAAHGGQVVGLVIETMKGINAASHKISDIIQVIDGLAFQTNILALNAAVEAARAGDQGRGFAVVATEVRSLAGRSAEAAKQIKQLINTSVERVDEGTALVDQAGFTMTDVVSAIKRVTDIMGEISAASKEQSLGVAQVGEAVMHMDQVTQQNAVLVDEMAAAASSLKSHAQELVQTVSVFTLNTNERYHARAHHQFALKNTLLIVS